MLTDGLRLVEGSDIDNAVVDSGASFPLLPDLGELFYRTDLNSLHVFDGGAWVQVGLTSSQLNGEPGSFYLDNANATGEMAVANGGTGASTAADARTSLGLEIGTDVQAFDGDLAALAALAGTSGVARKTAANTWVLDTTVYLTGNESISVSGDATGSGSTSISLTLTAVGTAGTKGSASEVPVFVTDSKGRVTSSTNTPIQIAESQITDGAILARVGGNETITGNWSFNGTTTGQEPTLSSHLTTKNYVDNVASGMNVHQAARAATTGALTATYDNGASGVGATLTGVGALPAIDGVTLAVNNRVLVKNQVSTLQNGIYRVSTLSPNWVLTRTADFDNTPAEEIVSGDSLYVQEGSLEGTQWVQITAGTITVGTTAIVFTQFGGPGTYVAGDGLILTGTTFDVVGSAGRIVVAANHIDLATTGVSANTYKSVTVDVYGRVSAGTNPTTLAGFGITDGQPLDTDLTAVAGLSSTGLIIRTGSGTATTRSVAVSGTGISISNADGISGNPTITSNATSANTASTIVARDGSGNFVAGTITASLSGNATTSTTAATATNALSLTGIAGSEFFRFEGFTLDANTMPASRSGFTYSVGAPHTGPITHFGATGYGLQINAPYAGGSTISFRTRNGDTTTWNAWQTILTGSNFNGYAPTLTGGGASGTWSINITGNAVTLGGLPLPSGSTNNEVNKIVRTDSNGYTNFGWINTISGDNGTTAIDRVYASSDAYIRYYTPGNFRTVLDVPKLSGQTNTFTGVNHFSSSGNTAAGSNPPLQAMGGGSNGAWMSFHRTSSYAVNMGLDNDNVFRIGGWSAPANVLQLSMAGEVTPLGNYNVVNYGLGMVGVYDAARYQNVFSMGQSYRPTADGTGLSNMYGIAWTHTNVGGQSKAGLSHQSLHVTAGVTQTAIGTGIWTIGDITAFSDARVKENVEIIPNALEKVEQLRGVTFTRNDIEDKTTRHAGVIAQEVEAVFPEVVTTGADGMKSVAYPNMVSVLIEAIKDLSAQNKVLLARIEALETK